MTRRCAVIPQRALARRQSSPLYPALLYGLTAPSSECIPDEKEHGDQGYPLDDIGHLSE
jgi:hypothetical protein